jgi:hypothetical protein
VYLTFLISVGIHGLLVIPFWQFRTLHLTVLDRPMQLVLEIPLTEQTQSVAPLTELPEQPQEKPAEIPGLSSPPLEQVKPVMTQTEVKPVTAAVGPVKALA